MLNNKISDSVAIWIDHRTAIMVYYPDDRFADGKNIWIEEGLDNNGQDHSLKHRNGHQEEVLKHYYDNIIQQLKHMIHVNDILILGPGPAKYELRQRIDHHKSLKGKVKNLENASDMSEAELKAYAAEYFSHPSDQN